MEETMDEVKMVEQVEDRIKMEDEDFQKFKSTIESLNAIRQELGRHFQLLSSLNAAAGQAEAQMLEIKNHLVSRYRLEKAQWRFDYETGEIVILK